MSLRVLVVEDDTISLTSLVWLLRKHGNKTVPAPSVHLALEALDREPFDFVLLDFHLPDGTGETILRRIRQSCPSVFVVIMTGSMHIDDLTRIKTLRPDAVLRKPLDISKLVEMFDHLQDGLPNMALLAAASHTHSTWQI